MGILLGDKMDNLKITRNINVISLSLIPFTALCVVTLLYIFLPVVANLSSILNVPPKSVAQLTTFFGIFYALGFLLWGGLSDKFGRKSIILGGLFSLSFITLMLTLTSDYRSLLFLRCLQGFFASSFPPVILVWLSETLDEKYRKRAISLISCSFLLAGTLGQWFGATMINKSINLSMYTLAVIYLLSGIIFYFLNKKINIVRPNKKDSLVKIFTQIPNVLLQKNLIRIYCSAFFVLMSFVCLYVCLNSFNGDVKINVNQLRKVATLGMFVSLFSSWLFSKISVTKVLASALLVMSITLIIQFFIIFGYISENYLLPLAHFIYVSSIALAIPSMITCSSLFSAQQNRGIAISLYTCILFIGASLGSLLPNYINLNVLFLFITTILFIVGISVSMLKQDLSLQSKI
jgi:MFS transporter, YNFM family, putative membrane transport protein